MIQKNADNKAPQLAELESLLALPGLPADKKTLIERELKMMLAGLKAERESAYDIDFYSGAHKNRIVIHDLRLEHQGRVAQIDHLIINRLLEVYVLETKHFSEGVSINEHGEFSIWFAGKARGIPSPLEQNDRHIAVLKDVFKAMDMPTRLGFRLQPNLESLVIVSKNARITRPKKFDTKRVIKSDQLESWIEKNLEKGGALQIAKLVSVETIQDIARQLVAQHRPIRIDYRAKFGITAEMLAIPAPTASAPREPAPPQAAATVETYPVVDEKAAAEPEPPTAGEEPAAATGHKRSKGFFCVACRASVSGAVAKFCWTNKQRFRGKVYCMDCQKAVG